MKINIKNRTIFCKDNLDILKGINSNCVDLIYIDPPFNKKKTFSAPIGSSAEGASFRDTFYKEDVKNEWLLTIKEDNDKLNAFLESVKTIEGKTSYNFCYLAYMAIRIIELHRILKNTGSFYLHCDNTMGHYLKILLDIIFGEKQFRNSIVWHYFKPHSSKNNYPKNYDSLFFYSKTNKYIFNYNATLFEYDEKAKKRYDKVDEEGNRYKIYNNKNGIIRKAYIKEGKPENIFKIPFVQGTSKERTGYPTQKPLALLERIIKASSKEGDIVLDAFCGCATTCVASEKFNRQWIGIDVSIKAYDLVKKRLNEEVKEGESALFNWNENIIFKTDSPIRTDDNRKDGREKKYVYIISHPNYKEFYKVGIAKDYQARLNSYQTSDPLREYKLEYKIETFLFRETEKHIHNTFDNLLEWVHASKQDIVNEINNFLNL